MTLPALGQVKYGSITFDGLIKSQIKATPVYDEANRTAVYIKYDLDIKARIGGTQGTTTDSQMNTWRSQLLTPGLGLTYDTKGFGQFNINTNLIEDVMWGPTPTSLNWIPIGNIGALVDWSVTVHIPACSSGFANYSDQPMAFNYDVEYAIDDDGLTTRTITGYLEIPMTRAASGGRGLTDSADNYRDKCVPKLLPGFRRNQRFKLSKDKRRIDFTITDTEMMVPLPRFVTKANVEHSISSRLGGGGGNFYIWDCSISGSVTMASQHVSDTFDVLMYIIYSRLDITQAKLKGMKLPKGVDVKGGTPTKWVTAFNLREEVLTRTTNFSLNYVIAGVAIDQIMAAAGLWQPLKDASFQTWSDSMNTANVYAYRGNAGMKFNKADDTIIDLCLSQPKVPAEIPSMWKEKPAAAAGAAPGPGNANWLDWRNKLTIIESDRVARHKPIGDTKGTPQPTTGPNPTGAIVSISAEKGGITPGVTSAVPDLAQRISSPTFTVAMEGYGLRIGARVPVPRLISVGGQPVTQLNQIVSEETLGGIGGVPMFETSWTIYYLVKGSPTGALPSLANPAIGIDGGTGPVGGGSTT